MTKQITAPMAGTMWKVLVQEGERFAAGQSLAILESMKMEIPIESEVDGTVDKIMAPEGTVVDEGSVVLTWF
ncbi:acetyl-CoA carboxylase biotin carboxyl carrier protein subunit [Janthinobacterium sp. PC23-8]|uniref:acetyl-CoA carboxylase biotin carboxyl carrier protein subunit n=1 Tax=Janthinobacterium sp. PC23-8 TaxID=2012679 RepID=UPI000B9763C2|nr:acetyl-CoA carboxylase biotin carboxyl carrier protein subunit [Janthinobacterium sp. PC23-8]OYO26339.1 acetyl-CoA carboxylase biotin carboxyl carrier protein subunit [Janthinobacterium sp. PC23-8]